ncbi:MAG: cytochrome c [Chloroflexi bacterium]|nr:cytochrome c [Chloroflexota bacterium]
MSLRSVWILAAAIALGACSGLGGEPEIAATAPPATEIAAVGDWRPDIDAGARIFRERCSECHGIRGDGWGELVRAGSVERPLDMTDRALVAAKSPLEWFEVITKGRIENLMPPWENALSEKQRWDVTLYSYTLAYNVELLAAGQAPWSERCADCALPTAIPPVFSDLAYGAHLNREFFGGALGEEEVGAAAAYARMSWLEREAASAQIEAPTGEIRGQARHGTAGGSVPAGTKIQLRFGSPAAGYTVRETTIDADLRFSLPDIPWREDFSYVVGAVYKGRLFSRRLPHFPTAEQTLTIYDETTDPLAVDVARIDMFVEAVTTEDWGAGLYVSQFVGFRNASDRLYTSGRAFDDGREAVLLLPFPRGARLLSDDQGGRFVLIEDLDDLPNSVIDTLPVAPGADHQIALEYFLPYKDGLDFQQEFSNQLDAKVTVTLSDSLTVTGGAFLAERDSPAADGARVYAGRLTLDEEPRLAFRIGGDPFATSSVDPQIVTGDVLPGLVAGAAALLIAALFGLGRLNRARGRSASEIDRLVAELARLDADHDQGRINHDLYHHRRRELKAKLAERMDAAE